MISSCPGVASQGHLVLFQGPRRRARDVPAVQVVDAVVAVAEDVGLQRAILDGALQVGAYGVEGLDVPVGRADHQTGLAAEVERRRPMPLGVDFELVDPVGGDDFQGAGTGRRPGPKETDDRIENGRQRGRNAGLKAAQEPLSPRQAARSIRHDRPQRYSEENVISARTATSVRGNVAGSEVSVKASRCGPSARGTAANDKQYDEQSDESIPPTRSVARCIPQACTVICCNYRMRQINVTFSEQIAS